ncbi:UNVERIFIED_CONTAM: hypothetical protein GTU68_064728 [Idotea baltica]|nr:hypothetical protein [Idotea baltica]
MLSEKISFHDKAHKIALLQKCTMRYFTIEEYKAKVEGVQKDKNDSHVYIYTNNPTQHDSFIAAAKEKGYDILLMDQIIDNHHMQQLESKLEKVTFKRVDADTASQLIEKEEHAESVLSEKELEKVTGLFKDRLNLDDYRLQFKPLSPSEHPVLITRPEFMRRMKEMQSMQGMGGMEMPDTYQVVVNTNHPLIVDKLLKIRGDEKKDRFVQYLYDLARLNQNLLEGSEMTAFINKSLEFIN